MMDDFDPIRVRAASDAERARIWAELVAQVGHDEASHRWLEIFGATDAPKTG